MGRETSGSDANQSPGLAAVRAAVERLGFDLPALVAQVSLWVPPEAHQRHVTPENPSGAVYPTVRRARPGSGERAGEVVGGVRLDRNNYAGAAIREALGGRGKALAGYQACHVWPATCYDPRYHTVLANLVLVPSPLVSLTDHDPDVIAAIQFRAFELYGWHPAEVSAPTRPPRYPNTWLPPAAIARGARRPRALEPVASSPGGPRQSEVLQRLWAANRGDREATIRAVAGALRSGEMPWRSNQTGQTPEQYAYRLCYNGIKKGLLR